MRKENGITVIALVITIIVLLILAGVIIIALTGDNGLIGKTSESKFITEIQQYNEELKLAITEDYTNSMGSRQGKFNVRRSSYNDEKSFTNDMKNKIPSFDNKYANKLEIKEDRLTYIGENEQERIWLSQTISVAGMLKINYIYENGTEAAPTYKKVITDGKYNIESPTIEGCEPDHYLVSGETDRDIELTVTYYPESQGLVFIGLDNDENETQDESKIVEYAVGNNKTIDQEIVIIPKTHNNKPVTQIIGSAFQNNKKIKMATIPETITKKGNGWIFQGCSNLEYLRVNIENTFNGYDPGFYGTENIKHLELGKKVKSIGMQTFQGITDLIDVTILSNEITGLDARYFSRCNNLKQININDNNTGYMVDDGILYSKDGKTLVLYPTGKTDEELKILDTVETIGEGACFSNNFLKRAEIPQHVKEEGKMAFGNSNNIEVFKINAEKISGYYSNSSKRSPSTKKIEIGKNVKQISAFAFQGCTNVEEFIFLGTIQEWQSINLNSIWWNGGSNITQVKCIDGNLEYDVN